MLNLDCKSELSKYSQKNNTELEYKLEQKAGLSHQKEFLVSVFLNSKRTASGSGKTKKEAEQEAAKKAIKNVY